MFPTGLHLLVYSFTYRCVLHYFLSMPVGFNFNLAFGLKPQVGGIKIVTVYKRSIFQVEWLIATLILFEQALLLRKEATDADGEIKYLYKSKIKVNAQNYTLRRQIKPSRNG